MEPELCVASWSVLKHRQPVRLVVHQANGTWFISCGEVDDPADLTTVHVSHLLDDPRQLLSEVRHLPAGQEAWRDDPSRPWEFSPAQED